MRIFMFSDIHFKLYGAIPQWNSHMGSGITEELNRAIKSMDFVINLVKEYKPDLVVCLGDVFHTLYTIDSPVWVSAYNSFQKLKEVSKELWVVSGNHDKYSSKIYATDSIPADRVFSSASEVLEKDGLKIAVVPYTDEKVMYEEIKSFDVDLVFTHMLFSGSQVNKYRIINNEYAPILGKKIFSGHVHQAQQIGDVIYLGSLYQIFPNEVGQKGAVIYDTDTEELSFYENTAVKYIYSLNVENVQDIFDLDPERFFIKAVLPPDIDIDLSEFEYSLIRTSKRETADNTRIEIDEIEKPEQVLESYIKQNYPHLLFLWEKFRTGAEK